MKRSILLIVVAAGWLFTTAAAQPPEAPLPGCPTTSTDGTFAGAPASAFPWFASVLNGDPQPLAATGQSPSAPASANPRVVEAYGRLPLGFEANQGQTAEKVKFLARGRGYALFLTPAEAVLSLHRPRGAEPGRLRPGSASQAAPGPAEPPAIVRLKLVGANPNPNIVGIDELPGKINYLRGNDPQQWRTNVPTYGKVQYGQVYPGIDLVYYGNSRQLEHDFVVAPGADPSVIGLELEGPGPACLDGRGDLVWATGAGEVRLQKPRIYQEVAGRRREVAGGYALGPGRCVGFEVGAYDATRTLVIDPVLVYATYLGGGGIDEGYGIAVDSTGSAYVTGLTNSPDFPGAAGSPVQPGFAGGVYDAFVAKLNTAGTALVYATYLGGNAWDAGLAIAVDSTGSAYVTGDTYSTDFPLAGSPLQSRRNGFSDAFVAKLTADGSALVYSTYLGGHGLGSKGYAITVDASGSAYVTGITYSTDFPVAGTPLQSHLSGLSNAFVAKLNADGSALVYSTYLGGNVQSSLGGSSGSGIAVDAAGNAYVTGSGAFVAKLNAAGSALVYTASLGGKKGESEGLGIAVDAACNAYVTGWTNALDFSLAGSPFQSSLNGSQDAFVAKFDAASGALVYATYLGGSGFDAGYGIAVDAAGNACVTGITNSTDFPGAAGSPVQPNFAGGVYDAFVAKLNAAGTALVYATYLGGSGGDFGRGIAVDAAGNAYVTGVTTSTDFPGATGSPLRSSLNGAENAFVAKIGIAPPMILSFTATPALGTVPLVGIPIVFKVTVADPAKVQSVQWDFNGDGIVDQTTTALITQFTYGTAGPVTAKVTVVDTDGGTASAATALTAQSPAQALTAAEALVQQLPLDEGQRNDLINKLEEVAKHLNRGKPADGCGPLGDVIHKINEFVKSGHLSAASAASLLNEVESIQRSLGCS